MLLIENRILTNHADLGSYFLKCSSLKTIDVEKFRTPLVAVPHAVVGNDTNNGNDNNIQARD